VHEERTPEVMKSMRSSTPGRAGSRYMRDEEMPSSNKDARARSKKLCSLVRARTARAEAIPKDSL
jgi:hypothetical protein